jgi:hypothetical protein
MLMYGLKQTDVGSFHYENMKIVDNQNFHLRHNLELCIYLFGSVKK